MQKYEVNQYKVSNILHLVDSNEIAIPEIQRPFVWNATKVRDLMDSLYRGYPVGYIVVWKNPNVRLKNGATSEGKKVLIDGQQRITALCAAILGKPVIDKDYRETRIDIAFNPITEEFATITPIIKKNTEWIPVISEFLSKEGGKLSFVSDYCDKNNFGDKDTIELRIDRLTSIKDRQLGLIELEHDLDIDTVTEIFIRINSKGVVLNQADFAMSKIASYGDFGANLRKFIDYFCHLARFPEFYKQISENDTDFQKSGYLEKITWLKNEKDDLYDPSYTDMLRVAFTKQFTRGKMSELVSLLSGRNFETREFEEKIQIDSYKKLEQGLLDFANETNFRRFIMILKSHGFVSPSLINSQNVLDFAYIVYLKLREKYASENENKLIDKLVIKWFVLSNLTQRYSYSPESMFDQDIKNIKKRGVEDYLKFIEETELSDNFWNISLPEELNKPSYNNPFINTFLAVQSHYGDKGFLSDNITVRSMLEERGDIHHVFPKDYLKKKYPDRTMQNQMANFVIAQTEVNIRIGNKAPKEYMKGVLEQCNGSKLTYGSITDTVKLKKNLKDHCIPEGFENMEIEDYPKFLEERRQLMAKKIEKYYKGL